MPNAPAASAFRAPHSTLQARLIWVICGGISTEHDVSIVSGRGVATALASGRWRVRPVFITREGQWRLGPEALGPEAAPEDIAARLDALVGGAAPSQPCEQALTRLRADQPACVFLALHGPGGEDGALQGMLNWFGVRYTCSGPSASAMGMNKTRCQAFFQQMGLRVPPSVSSVDVPESDRAPASRHAAILAARAMERLRLPVFVKPCYGGSSLGMSLVDEAGDLAPAIVKALESSAEALIEERIAGRELSCGVLDFRNDADGRYLPRALDPTEIRPPRSRYFDYEAKYTPGACEEITPAPLSAELTRRVRETALRAHTSLGCRGLSRTDFILRDDGELFVLEINTIPGLTPTSLAPQQARHAGLSYRQLCEQLVEAAIAKRIA